jgi:hypothetical protein
MTSVGEREKRIEKKHQWAALWAAHFFFQRYLVEREK